MKVYFNTEFNGRWPVGTAAIVAAESPERAAELLKAKLARVGLSQDVRPGSMILFEYQKEAAVLLCDGDY